MIDQADTMRLRILIVHLTGEIPQTLVSLPRLAPHEVVAARGNGVALCELPPDLTMESVRQTVTTLQYARATYNEIWVHATGLVREPAAAIARASDRITVLFALGAAVRDFWATQKTLLSARDPLTGFIAMSQKS
jgi:hypothetical protein